MMKINNSANNLDMIKIFKYDKDIDYSPGFDDFLPEFKG